MSCQCRPVVAAEEAHAVGRNRAGRRALTRAHGRRHPLISVWLRCGSYIGLLAKRIRSAVQSSQLSPRCGCASCVGLERRIDVVGEFGSTASRMTGTERHDDRSGSPGSASCAGVAHPRCDRPQGARSGIDDARVFRVMEIDRLSASPSAGPSISCAAVAAVGALVLRDNTSGFSGWTVIGGTSVSCGRPVSVTVLAGAWRKTRQRFVHDRADRRRYAT